MGSCDFVPEGLIDGSQAAYCLEYVQNEIRPGGYGMRSVLEGNVALASGSRPWARNERACRAWIRAMNNPSKESNF
jgi:hypothetical protein